MKKLALATAVAAIAASGAASAATIYEKDNLKYTIKGDVQIQLLKQAGDDEKLDVNYDDTELKNSVVYKIDDSMSAFAQLDYNVYSLKAEEAYVGFDFGVFKVWAGKTDYATDAFGVESNIDVVDVAGDAFPEDGSDDLILAEFAVGPANVAVSFDLEDAEGEASSSDLMVTVPAGPVEIGLAFQAYSASDVDTDTFGVSAAGDFGPVGLGLAYSSSDEDGVDDTTDVTSVVASVAGFTVGYDITEMGDDEVNAWYANYVYKFPTAKNVSVFVEVGDTDEDNVDLGYLAGMRVVF